VRQISLNLCNKLLRRSFVVGNGLYCKEGLVFEDNLWAFYLIKYLKKAACLEDVTYHQKKRPKSITTGSGESLRIRSLITIYCDIFSNLTPEFAREEYEFFTKEIIDSYFIFVRLVPDFHDVMLKCRELARAYGTWRLRVRLAIISFLGRFKHGDVAWEIVRRITHQRLVLVDIGLHEPELKD